MRLWTIKTSSEWGKVWRLSFIMHIVILPIMPVYWNPNKDSRHQRSLGLFDWWTHWCSGKMTHLDLWTKGMEALCLRNADVLGTLEVQLASEVCLVLYGLMPFDLCILDFWVVSIRNEMQYVHLRLKQNSGTFVMINEPLLILYYKMKSIVCFRVYSLCCTASWVLTNS